jgi:hypothetical protein
MSGSFMAELERECRSKNTGKCEYLSREEIRRGRVAAEARRREHASWKPSSEVMYGAAHYAHSAFHFYLYLN